MKAKFFKLSVCDVMFLVAGSCRGHLKCITLESGRVHFPRELSFQLVDPKRK